MVKKPKYTRMQFDFSDEAKKRFEALQTKMKHKTGAELLRQALQVFEYLVEMGESGYKLELTKGDDRIEMDLSKV